MRFYLSLIIALVLCSFVAAQDESSSYETALARIEAAQDATEIDLSNLFLTELPPEIGNLTNLQILDLSDNQLSSLPPEIANLANLKTLYLYDNQLTSLPIEITNLPQLQQLALGRNQLTSLPAEIGNLSNLAWLILSDNQLSTLPAEIGNLTNLQTLDLANNQLNTLPSEIGNLAVLCNLELENNQLQTLPVELGQLQALRISNAMQGCGTFTIEGNPLTYPASVTEQGSIAVLDYLRNGNTNPFIPLAIIGGLLIVVLGGGLFLWQKSRNSKA